MYKPPENTNRVKAMKMKFECPDKKIVKEDIEINKPKTPNYSKSLNISSIECENIDNSTNTAKPQQILNRQLSDPVKRNIKRTPAFRLDKNTFIEKEHIFQRHLSQNNIKSRMEKLKSLDDSSRLKENCDNVNINNNLTTKLTSNKMVSDIKSKLYSIRDKSSICTQEKPALLNIQTQSTLCERNDINTLKDLYAEPIPKSLRSSQKLSVDDNFILHKTNTFKMMEEKCNQIETAQKVITILKDIDQQVKGSDTIKNALKRPLPPGPAPKKPPRTFQHSPQSKSKLDVIAVSKSDPNIASLKLEKEFTDQLNLSIEKQLSPRPKTKRDPKYMLDKLENALKSNKIKLQRQVRVDSNSEDDEAVKPAAKSLCNSPLLKRLNNNSILSSNQMFNCLPSLSCSKNTYARIKEPTSSLPLMSKDEPVYAEPFQYAPVLSQEYEEYLPHKEKNPVGIKRNSLYYMSNPVLGIESEFIDVKETIDSEMEHHAVKDMVNQCETSSLSTFSSDSDSNAPSPVHVKESNPILVKDLIKSFESKVSSHEESNDKVSSISLRNVKQKSCPDKLINNNENAKRYGIIKDLQRTSERKKKDTTKFEIYVKTVRAFSIRKMNNTNLFHCCLLVGLDEKCPYIKSKFPSNVQVPAYIEKLCFPDSEDHRVSYSAREQCYSLVITDASGERIYGYCRRVLPEGSCCCLPLAYCILTKNRAPRFYKRILQELESHHGLPDKQRDAVINEFYQLKFPKPGQSIKLDLSKIIHSEVKYYGTETIPQNNNIPNRKSDDGLNGFCLVQNACPHGFITDSCNTDSRKMCESCRAENSSELTLTLHQDTRYEETDLKELCDTLDVSILQKVFENLLLERKVIFTSCQLSKLSSCIEAIQSVLYPFSWPHAFIPVLPKTRWEIVEAPAPLICGVLSSTVVNDYKIENAIVVDLDSKEILLEVDEDEKILPCSVLKLWKKGLNIANSIRASDNEHNVLLSDAFIRVFIQTCGHYKDYISNGTFNKEGFKNLPTSKGVKRFLQWFTLTTMFDLFIDAVLSNPDSFYIFDSRISIYSSQDATLILQKMKDWKTNLKF